tara:strand:+ start:1101 stop:1328 length:228 start_codon:yes stop_codon:yes gene_type:complete
MSEGCRISEEDRGDSHFDCDEALDFTEEFNALYSRVDYLVARLDARSKWAPDAETYDALESLFTLLKYYEKDIQV